MRAFLLRLLCLLAASLASAQTTLTIQSAQNLPDVAAGVAGKGFTCTGICQHSDGTTWWVMNYGFTDSQDVTLNGSSVVHLSADFSTNLGEIDLAALGSASMQGLVRTPDNLLWMAAGSQLRCYNEAGTLQTGTVNTINPVGGCNGLTYDSVRDVFYILQGSGAMLKYLRTPVSCTADASTDKITATAHGLSDGQQISFASTSMPGGLGTSGTVYFIRDSTTNDFKVALTNGGTAIDITSAGTTVVYRTLASLSSCTATGPDHLTMVNGKVWCAAGQNNHDGTIWEYNPANDAGGWTQLYTLSGGNAEEGIFVVGSTIYLMNDGLYHAPAPDNVTPALNRALIYTIPTTYIAAIKNPNRYGRRGRR